MPRVATTQDLLPFPMTASELEAQLHKICDSLGCWEAEIGYDPEFERLYLKLND